MSEDNVAIRLKVFIEQMGLSNSQFADQCGIPRPSLSQLLTGRNKKISDVLVGQIHTAFPKLSVLWLLFGEGPMLVGDKTQAISQSSANASIGDNLFSPLESSAEVESEEYTPGGEKQSVTFRPRSSAEKIRDSKVEELKLEIEKLRNKPRKVSQITVYYDDSTFETFFPASGSSRH